jgi:hypothetical protein
MTSIIGTLEIIPKLNSRDTFTDRTILVSIMAANNAAITAHGQVGHPAVDFFKMLATVKDRLVLSDGGNNVVAFFVAAFRDAFQGQVIAFSSA